MRFFRPRLGAVIFLAFSLCLGGCGRRGPLEPPPDAAALNAPPAANGGGETQSAAKTEPAKAPPRPFILDPLL